MEFIYLTGSEDVEKAGYTIRDAAAEMNRAANQIWEAMQQFERNVDRLEVINTKDTNEHN